MNERELVAALKQDYEASRYGEVAVAVYLFGMKHWKDLAGFDSAGLLRISEEATGKNFQPGLNTASKLGAILYKRQVRDRRGLVRYATNVVRALLNKPPPGL